MRRDKEMSGWEKGLPDRQVVTWGHNVLAEMFAVINTTLF